jgi:hypothetical protein
MIHLQQCKNPSLENTKQNPIKLAIKTYNTKIVTTKIMCFGISNHQK